MQVRNYIFRAGLDIGSTTAKLVILDRNGVIIYSQYKRHNTKIYQTVNELLSDADCAIDNVAISLLVTGSAGIGLCENAGLPFIQEIIASTEVIRAKYPATGTLIDIGGEDSKMIFFHDNKMPDIRMNGSCAGGTGAFIDQMASILNIPMTELDITAQKYSTIYPIASRCGVFAKTDIQNLLSRKIPKEDIVASVFHAVAIQALNTLARAFEVKPKIMFSGGPFSFLPELKKHFCLCLKISENDIINTEHPELLSATGAALENHTSHIEIRLKDLKHKIENTQNRAFNKKLRLQPLFNTGKEYSAWNEERFNKKITRISIKDYGFKECFLGIDSGSTTTKIVLTGKNNEFLFGFYTGNKGNPIHAVRQALEYLNEEILKNNSSLKILRTSVTGYGEDLIKAAFGIDSGIVETIAHYTAAKFYNEKVSFILDIGGQDMKAIFINNGIISHVELNEACSSGCGSFIETFGSSLGYNIDEFASLACQAESPCDLGTRCTVFMNSKIKQSLRENATAGDIAAGLSISVIKNALFKVLKLKDITELGDYIIIQGGTFKNPSIHKALEFLTGKKVICSDIPEMMGAFGAALAASTEYSCNPALTTFIGFDNLCKIEDFSSNQIICKGCENNCKVAKFFFGNNKIFYSGNKCEKIFSSKGEKLYTGVNLYDFKNKLLFERPVKPDGKVLLKIGIPRVLNIYENYPFWNTLFTGCGFEIILSPHSSMNLYKKGQGTIMSDSICFPAKLAHGHIIALAEMKPDRIFYPMVVYEKTEFENIHNTYNCPIVSGYPDVIRSALNPAVRFGIPFDAVPVSFNDVVLLKKNLWRYFKKFGVKKKTYAKAFQQAFEQQHTFKEILKEKARTVIKKALEDNRYLIVLAGRPYHTDMLINHKIPALLCELGVDVISEDAIPGTPDNSLSELQVITQWAYPNRIYEAARWISLQPWNIQLVQINSFGCGPDAVVIDETSSILKQHGKNLTLLRVDEITSTGSVRLRLRSLIESLKLSEQNKNIIKNNRVTTTPFMPEDKRRTLIAPVFSEIYSRFFPALFSLAGYNLINLPLPDKQSVDTGLKYSNNEICYPATIVIGDIIKALQSGKYDRNEVAVTIMQTGGQCRASSYIALIKKAMVAAGFSDIPVVSIGTGGITINYQPGFNIEWRQVTNIAFITALYADSIAKMYYSSVVREKNKGASKALLDKYIDIVQPSILNKDIAPVFHFLEKAVNDFNSLDINDGDYPKIGVVGEIYIKYNSFGHYQAVDWLIKQGIETIVPPLVDFFTQELINYHINRKSYLINTTYKSALYIYYLEYLANKYTNTANGILSGYKYFTPFHKIRHVAKSAENILSRINQFGEGWLIPAEMAMFAEEGINNIVSLQPFGCIANHIISKGIEKRLKDLYPSLSVLYLDFDDGTSEVNILNRLHFMVRNVKKAV